MSSRKVSLVTLCKHLVPGIESVAEGDVRKGWLQAAVAAT